jgi:hypothetical protein
MTPYQLLKSCRFEPDKGDKSGVNWNEAIMVILIYSISHAGTSETNNLGLNIN